MTDDDPTDADPDAPGPIVVEPAGSTVAYADWIVTGGSFEGVVNISLGTVDYSLRGKADEPFRVIVCANLRMSTAFATRLHAALGHILGEPQQGSDDAPPPPPGTLVN